MRKNGDNRLNNSQISTTNRLLAALPDEELQRLVPNLERVSLTLGEVIYDASERVRHVYFLNKNTLVSVITTMENGTGVEACIVGSEGLVGIQSFLRTETTPARIVVQAAGSSLRIRAELLREEFNRGGILQDRLLHYTHALVTQISQTAACNHLHTVEERLSRWLLTIHDRLAGNIPFTHELISRRLGAHRTSVNKVAGILRREGMISYNRGKITILDREALSSIVCECYGIIKEQFDFAFDV